ncbi:MAG: 4-amino-4-deoxy-L-arabinose transferase or related glycosyltransferase of family [Actinomycetia bacterium]|nr:4-amino-4-deoxy-L-arabinose transferase or related glycosyltransferase of family [Actinomycetes bacterium]
MGVATDADRATDATVSTPDSSAGWARFAGIGALALIAAAGALKLAYPLSGDQALFASGGREILHGAVLYRDFWDVKQPAIYLFYAGGGAVFGFSAVGIHLFELVYMLGFAFVLQRTLRPLFGAPWIPAAASVLAVGTYYAGASTSALTQVEILVGFPLYLGVWFALSGAPGRSRGRLFWSGVLGGVVCWFKYVYLPIVAFAWVLVLLRRPEGGRRRPSRELAADAGAIVAGLAVPIVAFLVYFGAHGQLSEIRWTYFTFTPKTTGIAGRPVSRLTDGAKDFAEWTAPVLLLAVVGFVTRLRRGWSIWWTAYAGWIVLSVPLFLIQHWWLYQYELALVPLAIFAAAGLEWIVRTWSTARTTAVVVSAMVVSMVVVLSAIPLGLRFGRSAAVVARHDLGLTAAGRRAIADREDPQYPTARALSAFLGQQHVRGDIYVLGDPVDLYVSGRDQAIPTNGWSPEQYDSVVWKRIADGIRQARPRLLVMDESSTGIMKQRAPATLAVVHRLYRPVRRVGTDTWYELRN